MHKTISLILCILLFLPLAGCSGDNGGPAPENYDFVITTDFVRDSLAAYLPGESYQTAVAAFESVMNSKSGGCLLEKALEYHLADLNGFKVDALLLTIKADVLYGEDILGDNVQVYIDLNTGDVVDSLSIPLDDYTIFFDGTIHSEEELQAILMNTLYCNDPYEPVFYSSQGAHKALTAEQIAAVNDELGLQYNGYESAKEAEESVDDSGRAILFTGNDERIQKAIDTAKAFQESPHYQQLSDDPTGIRLDSAMEFKLDNMEGYPVHILLIHADSVNPDLHGLPGGTALLDMTSGAVYTAADLDLNDIGGFECIENCFAKLLSAYDNILCGTETTLWFQNESSYLLSAEELATVNESLNSFYAQTAEQADTLRLEQAVGLSDWQRLFFDAAMEAAKTARFKQAAFDPSSLQLSAGGELSFRHPENGFELHVLLLQAQGIDTNMYGFSAGTYIKDLNSSTLYTDTDFDLTDWTWDWDDYSDPLNPIIAALLSYDSFLNMGQTVFFMEEEELFVPLSAEDLAAVNAALNP